MAGKKGMHDKTYKRPEALERIRARIINSQIIDRLMKHALGEIELSNSQVQAAIGLLRKVLPDLASSEIKVESVNYINDLEAIQGAGLLRPDPADAAQQTQH